MNLPSPRSLLLHNRLIPFFLLLFCSARLQVTSLLCHPLHTFVAPFFSRSLCSWSNQCRWWIIHSVLCRLKLFDGQLYSHVSYIINWALLGIAAIGEGHYRPGWSQQFNGMKSPSSNRTLCLFLCPLSPPPCFHMSSLFLFRLACPPEGHCLLKSHRAKFNVAQVAFWSVFWWEWLLN